MENFIQIYYEKVTKRSEILTIGMGNGNELDRNLNEILIEVVVHK